MRLFSSQSFPPFVPYSLPTLQSVTFTHFYVSQQCVCMHENYRALFFTQTNALSFHRNRGIQSERALPVSGPASAHLCSLLITFQIETLLFTQSFWCTTGCFLPQFSLQHFRDTFPLDSKYTTGVFQPSPWPTINHIVPKHFMMLIYGSTAYWTLTAHHRHLNPTEACCSVLFLLEMCAILAKKIKNKNKD